MAITLSQRASRPENAPAGRPAARGLGGVLRPRRRPDGSAPVRAHVPARPSTAVTAALYDDDGRLASRHTNLAQTFAELRSRPGGMALIELARPAPAELSRLAAEFDLHELAVEDAIQAHQRPKLERYGDTLFVVLHAARYDDAAEEVEFSELHLFVGTDFVISVRHGSSPDVAEVRRRLEAEPEILARGPEAVLYGILDAVVDGYLPVVTGLENDVDEIESEVFSAGAEASRRIYELSREVADFQRAARPLRQVCHALTQGFAKYKVDEEMQARLRDVVDHLTEVAERIETLRSALRDILTVNATLVAQRQNEEAKLQNEEVKKISSWAAILFAPTVVGGIYGMNFDVMPELHWAFGYPFALGLMVAVSVVLWAVFRLRKWI